MDSLHDGFCRARSSTPYPVESCLAHASACLCKAVALFIAHGEDHIRGTTTDAFTGRYPWPFYFRRALALEAAARCSEDEWELGDEGQQEDPVSYENCSRFPFGVTRKKTAVNGDSRHRIFLRPFVACCALGHCMLRIRVARTFVRPLPYTAGSGAIAVLLPEPRRH